MSVAVNLKIVNKVDNNIVRSITSVTLDYPTANDLPAKFELFGKAWDRQGALGSTNFKEWEPPEFPRIDDKVIEV